MSLGVYVSVPFCRAKCSFCNFASGVSTAEPIHRYVRQLCAEIDGIEAKAAALNAELPREVDTIYFGGGTPSLLKPAQLAEIFAALRRNFKMSHDPEITLEAAPGQIEDALLAEALRLGVNRVSLGVQSFVDRESAAVGRTHTGVQCLQEIARLKAEGVAEVGADLIAGLPYQTRESWRSSLEAACAAVSEDALTHLSVYLLEIDEGSRLGREVLGGGARLHAPAVASEEMAADLYGDACEFLEAQRFAQYEISNFARRNGTDARAHQSRHNRRYWERAPYVGFGLDAHSMLPRGDGSAIRFANHDVLAEYHRGTEGERMEIGEREAFEETIFLGLRLNDGLVVEDLRRRFAEERVDACQERALGLAREELMHVQDGRWRLTLRGRLISSEIFGEMLAVAA